jgi:PAS domain S-box-containing protein
MITPDDSSPSDGGPLPTVSVAPFAHQRRNQSLALALEATLTSIWDYDIPSHRVTLDANWARMLGEAAGPTVVTIRRLFARVHGDDRTRAAAATLDCLTGKCEEYSQEYRVRDATGDWIWVHSRGRVLARDGEGRATRLIGTNIDITARKASELATSRQVEFLRALNRTAFTLLDRRSKTETLNVLAQHAAQLLDAGLVELALLKGDELVTQASVGPKPNPGTTRIRRGEAALSWRALDSREPVIVDNYGGLAESDPAYRAARFDAVAIFPILLGADCLGVLCILRNPSGRTFSAEDQEKGVLLAQLAALAIHNAAVYDDAVRVAEERTDDLRQSERLYRTLVETVTHAHFIADTRSVITYCNPAMHTLGGYAFGELLHQSAYRLVAEVDRERIKAQYRRWVANPAIDHAVCEFRAVAKNGRQFWVQQSTHFLRDNQGRVIEGRNLLQDIDERRAAEAERDRSLALAQATLESTTDGVLVVDARGRIETSNANFARLWQIPAAIMSSPDDRAALQWIADQAVDPEVFLLRVRELQSTPDADSADVVQFKDGRTFERFSRPLRVDQRATGRVWSFRDVTAARQAAEALQESESQLRQAQKMESLGTLAGGIAHDFNNILTGILGYTQLALSGLAPDHEAHGWLEGTLKSGERAKSLVNQILTFSRKTESTRCPVRLQQVAVEALELLRSTLPPMVRLESHVDPGCPLVFANANEFHQVILNLCTNAWHALPAQGGWIDVRLEPAMLSQEEAARRRPLRAGPHVRLAVRDNGCGMNATTVERIYEPFFTTKEAGKGTGLGMAVVHSVINAHQGGILIESAPGAGTLVEILIPTLAAAEASAPPMPVRELPRGNGESVLVVDDEASSGSVIAKLAERLGYRTTYCAQPQEALALLEAGRFDILVTDLAMPGLTGDELARRALAWKASLPILLVSGFIEPAMFDQLRQLGVREILAKPPALPDLAAALERCAAGVRGNL